MTLEIPNTRDHAKENMAYLLSGKASEEEIFAYLTLRPVVDATAAVYVR